MFPVRCGEVECDLFYSAVIHSIRRHVLPLSAAFFATAALLRAHPGHDGHDFSWDFHHLANYPDATILCLGAAGAVGWVGWKVMSARTDAPKAAPVRLDDVRREP
jgi:hypothetical protein